MCLEDIVIFKYDLSFVNSFDYFVTFKHFLRK